MIDEDDDKPFAVLKYGEAGYDGAGWYYWDEEYPDEGSVGAFATRADAEAHARDEGGYQIRQRAEKKKASDFGTGSE